MNLVLIESGNAVEMTQVPAALAARISIYYKIFKHSTTQTCDN